MSLPAIIFPTVRAITGIPIVALIGIPLVKAVATTIAATAVTATIVAVGYQLGKEYAIDSNGDSERNINNE